jgi:hypothetical protein
MNRIFPIIKVLWSYVYGLVVLFYVWFDVIYNLVEPWQSLRNQFECIDRFSLFAAVRTTRSALERNSTCGHWSITTGFCFYYQQSQESTTMKASSGALQTKQASDHLYSMPSQYLIVLGRAEAGVRSPWSSVTLTIALSEMNGSLNKA